MSAARFIASSPRRGRCACAYTLVEMVVVTVILMMALALVLPRLGGGSRRMAAEQALSELRAAFGETAMRARTTGRPLDLTLFPQEGLFRVTPSGETLDRDWHPQGLPPLTGEDGRGGILPGTDSYPVPKGVEWTELPEETEASSQGGILFRFFPDGEACGPPLAWRMHGRNYRLVMDSVLGKATILEMEEGRP